MMNISRTTSQENIRDYSLDNIRFFLILAVVFAHLLEVCSPFAGQWTIYKVIYTFHMPAFIFLFGYNVTYSPKRIIFRWAIPYVIFQSLYIIFTQYVLNTDMAFQYTTPYWLLWYMLACIFYQLLLPLFDTTNKRRQIVILICAIIIALLVGYEETVGYYMSLSRFFVFQPWFILGYYFKKNRTLETLLLYWKTRFAIVVISIVIIVLSVPYLMKPNVQNGLLFGSFSYAGCGATVWMRATVLLISLCWIFFLFMGIKSYINKKIFFITAIGQNTWSVFLLHGFFVKAIPVFCPELLLSPYKVILTTCAILLLLGNKIVNRLVYYICFSWLEKLFKNDIN